MSFPSKQEYVAYSRRFNAIFKRSNVIESASIVVANLVAFCFLVVGSNWIFSFSLLLGILTLPVFFWMIAMRYRALVNIVHECAHGSFTSTKRGNIVFGELLSIFCWMRFRTYQSNHMTHHVYTGDVEKDLSFSNIEQYEFDRPIDRVMLKRHLRRIFSLALFRDYGGQVVYDAGAPLGWRIGRCLYLSALVLISIPAGPVWIGPYIVLLYVVAPRVLMLPVIGYVSDVLDHGGVLGEEDENDKSRNYIVKNRILRAIFFPRNDCYHLIHHLFPTLPTKHMPACHEVLMAEIGEYREKIHSLSDWTRSSLRRSDPSDDGLKAA
jgi:fatty acid desaturase